MVALSHAGRRKGQDGNTRFNFMRPNKIAVVGPGVVGMPLTALLASTRGNDGSPPPRVVAVQRRSPTSGWKVDAINAGRSPVRGSEPGLERLVAHAVAGGTLTATHDPASCADADVIVIAVQTERVGLKPDYALLIDAIDNVARAVRNRPVATRPLIVVESTIAPSTMQSIVRPRFASHHLFDGQDILLVHSPSRVMQGRVLEQVATTDRLVGGLHPEAPVLAASLYRRIVTRGRVLATSGLTTEIVRTLENAARDVRIAFATEIARYCDRIDVDFNTLRDQVNDVLGWRDDASWDGAAVPTGALLVPTVGVGGHCLPRDGIYLWWRALEAGHPSRNSLFLAARSVNDASPAATVRLARLDLGPINERRVAVLGASFRADTSDSRNSPSLVLANLLRDSGATVSLHDPYVAGTDTHIVQHGLADSLTDDIERALDGATLVFLASAHRAYRELLPRLRHSSGVVGVVDGCNLFQAADFDGSQVRYTGIGRGRHAPDRTLVKSVASMYRALARGMANEVDSLVRFYNGRYADDVFSHVDAGDVRRLASSYLTLGIDEPGDVPPVEAHNGFVSGLAQLAVDASRTRTPDPRRGPPEPVPPGIWFGNEDAVVAADTPWPLTPLQ